MAVQTMVDPPFGWKYGFPKPLPRWVHPTEFNAWLVTEGYPQQLIDRLSGSFSCRYWIREVQDSGK